MKHLVVITLIGLIAIVCLVPTHLHSNQVPHSGETWARDCRMGRTLKFVYGYLYVAYFYEFPKVSSSHLAVLYNDSGGVHPDWPQRIRVRYYVDFTSKIEGPLLPNFDDFKEEHTNGWVDAVDSWEKAMALKFDLKDQPWRKYKITADSKQTVKADLDGNGTLETSEPWYALISQKEFWHRQEPLGIE